MNKKIVQAVQERSGGVCEVCGGTYLLQMHHKIHGKGKRKLCENKYSIGLLCWYCHHSTKYGIHGKNGKKLDLELKKQLQDKLYEVLEKEYYTEGELIEILLLEEKQTYLLLRKLDFSIDKGYRKEDVIWRLMGGKLYV